MRIRTSQLVEVAEVSLPVAFLLERYEAEGVVFYENGFYDPNVDDFYLFFVNTSTAWDTMYEQLTRAGADVDRRAGDLIVWFRKHR